MKRLVNLILVFVLAFSLFGCNNPSGGGGTDSDKLEVYVVPTVEKYKLEQDVNNFDKSVSISVAKNEYESAQIIIKPNRNISALDISLSDFVCGDNTIKANMVDIYLEHYVFIGKNDIKNSEKTGFTEGYYPDAIVPLSLRKEKAENKVKKGQNQGIWLTVRPLAMDTIAGNYVGNLVIDADGKKTSVDMSIEVFDFAIGSENHFKTAFAIWDGMPDDMLFDAYQDSDPKIAENYYDFMLDYRVSPTHIPNIGKLSVEEQKTNFIKNIKRENVGSLALPYTVTNTSVGFDESKMTTILEALAMEAIARPELIDKTYAYFTYIDEPIVATYPRVKIVNNAFNNLLIDVANRKLSAGGLEKTKEAFINIQCVNTTHLTKDKYDAGLVNTADNMGIDTWCPTFDYYNSEMYRKQMEERKAFGDGAWWYGCVEPRNPFPTMSVNDHMLPQRTVAWMQMQYGIEGQLFWSTNAYGQYSYEVSDYIYRDVWKDAVAFPSAPGDGYLTYPGFKYGLKSPIATMRLDNFRASQEDYEYLYLLKSLFQKNKPAEITYDFDTYVANLYTQLYQGTIADLDTRNFELVRYELAKLVESASKGVFVDISVNPINNKCAVNVFGKDLSNVKLNDKELSSSPSGAVNKYSGSFFVDATKLYADISYTYLSKNYLVTRYTGGKNMVYNKFDDDTSISDITVTKQDKYSDADILLSATSQKAISGKAMKVEYKATPNATLAYLPTFTIKNASKIDLQKSSRFQFSVFNESARDIEITIIAVDGSNNKSILYKTYALAGKWTNTDIHTINADMKLLDLKDIKELRFNIGTIKSTSQECNLYFDNMFFAVNN